MKVAYWLSQIKIHTIWDKINRLEHPINHKEEPAVEIGQNEQKPQKSQLQHVDDSPPNLKGQVQEEE